MPYNPDGSFTLTFTFGTGTAPNNQFPPQVGNALDDIATSIAISNLLSKFSDSTVAPTFSSLVVGTPTGGNKGAGSINGATIYLNGTQLTSAATTAVGVGPNELVQFNGSTQYPAADGSLITGISSTGRLIAGTPLVMNPVVLSSNATQAHGLGVVPALIRVTLTCLTANAGYSAGAIIDISAVSQQSAYVGVYFDTTNVYLVTSANNFQLTNPSTHAVAAFTAADWSITATPYKLS